MLGCVGQASWLLVVLASTVVTMGLEDASRGPLAIPRLEWGTQQAFASIAGGLPCILSGIQLIESVVERDHPALRNTLAEFHGRCLLRGRSGSSTGATQKQVARVPRPTSSRTRRLQVCVTDAQLRRRVHACFRGTVVGGRPDFAGFSDAGLESAVALKVQAAGGKLRTNLLGGSRGAVTPAHYDEQDNILVNHLPEICAVCLRLGISTRCTRIPDYPCDRQSQLIIPVLKDGGKRQPLKNSASKL